MMKLKELLPYLHGIVVNDHKMIYSEELQEILEKSEEQDWESIQIQASISVMSSLVSGLGNSEELDKSKICQVSVDLADTLITELKKRNGTV